MAYSSVVQQPVRKIAVRRTEFLHFTKPSPPNTADFQRSKPLRCGVVELKSSHLTIFLSSSRVSAPRNATDHVIFFVRSEYRRLSFSPLFSCSKIASIFLLRIISTKWGTVSSTPPPVVTDQTPLTTHTHNERHTHNSKPSNRNRSEGGKYWFVCVCVCVRGWVGGNNSRRDSEHSSELGKERKNTKQTIPTSQCTRPQRQREAALEQ
jgi:hypothetical protein